jgi:cytochrome c-type biogenesis protein CcmH/NrfG
MWIAGGCVLLGLISGSVTADVVTLKNGREIEGLITNIDEERLTLRRAAEGVTQSWQLTRSEITSLRLAPPDVSGFRSVARRFDADRSPDEACEAWRRVCVLRPEGAPDQICLIQSYRRRGRLEDACAAAQSAARAHPKDHRIMLEQGEVALAQGRADDAVALARAHLQLTGPASEAGTWLLARGLEQSRQAQQALDAYRGLLRDQPRRSDALERYTDLALGEGKAEEAAEEAGKVARVAPDLRAGWIALGKIRYRQCRFPEAVTAFQSATRLGGPDYDRARIFLQCALARRYDRDPRAVLTASDLEIAPQLDPELRRDSP